MRLLDCGDLHFFVSIYSFSILCYPISKFLNLPQTTVIKELKTNFIIPSKSCFHFVERHVYHIFRLIVYGILLKKQGGITPPCFWIMFCSEKTEDIIAFLQEQFGDKVIARNCSVKYPARSGYL